MNITIKETGEIRKQLGLTHLVIFGVDASGTQHVATHGGTPTQAKEAAKAGNNLKQALGWPDEMCNEKPLPRIHENCAYYEKDWGHHCFNGWSGDGKSGFCNLEPEKTKQIGAEIACMHFVPRG